MMFTRSLTQVGGSVMLPLPPFVIQSLQLAAGKLVTIRLDTHRKRIIITPSRKPKQ